MTDDVDMAAGVGGVGGGEQTPAARKEVWTGHIRRGDAPDKIVGELVDTFGWRLRLEGCAIRKVAIGRWRISTARCRSRCVSRCWMTGVDFRTGGNNGTRSNCTD